jgi:hypothetical protein
MLPRRFEDENRAKMRLWGIAGTVGDTEIDVEFRSGIPSEVVSGAGFVLGPMIAEASRRSWELRNAVAEIQRRWREGLRNPPPRFRLDDPRIGLVGTFVFQRPASFDTLANRPVALMECDLVLLSEFADWLYEKRDLVGPRTLVIEGIWDLSPLGTSVRSLHPPGYAWDLYARRRWAASAAAAVGKELERLRLERPDRPIPATRVVSRRGNDTGVRFVLEA